MTDITKMTDERLGNILSDALNDAINDHGILSWRYFARYVRSLIPPAAQPVARVPVAMTSHAGFLAIACNDGTVWWLDEHHEKWVDDPPIPQPDATPTKFALPPASTRLTPAQEAAQDKDRQQAEEAMHDAVAADERELHEFDPVQEAAHELLQAAKDVTAGWRYRKEHETVPPSLGFDRTMAALERAIAKAEQRS